VWAPGLLVLAFLAVPAAQAGETGARLTLDEALLVAAERSPELRARRAEVDEARGRLLAARTYPYNPRIEVEAGRRSGGGAASTDRALRLSQAIELGGKRRRRSTAAGAELAAAEARLVRAGRRLTARVELAFATAVRARELRGIAELDAALAQDFLELSSKRLAAGAGTQLDLNLARATRGRAERRLAVARATELESRGLLAESVGLGPASLPEPAGEASPPRAETSALADLLAAASANRADLEAFRREREAAEARLRLARAERIPDLEVGFSYEREEGTDDVVGGGLAIDLPLFNRNRGAVAEADATRRRVAHEAAALELGVAGEVVAAWATLSAAASAEELLREQVLGSLEESLELLRRAFEAGKIGTTELLLFRRELVESRREYVETLTDAWLARVALDLAAGRVPPLELNTEATEE